MANAMGLATTTKDGVPALRTVLLKACSNDGVVFFTSPDTLKVRQWTHHASGSPDLAAGFDRQPGPPHTDRTC